MQFNEKLKDLRVKKGISQAELAEQIFVSRSAVAKWENGLGLPSEASLNLLAEYFSVNKEELYSDETTEVVIVNKNITILKSRKLLICVSVACILIFIALITTIIMLTGNRNKSIYKVPENCCVISVPTGFELWTNKSTIFNKIETNIEGIKRKENRNYYVIEKDMEFSIINYAKYIYDSPTDCTGKIITGFNVLDSVIPVEPYMGSDIVFSCNRNLDIEPVYEDFVKCGIFISIINENDTVWEKINNANDYFNADGTIKNIEDLYYILSKSTNFETNLPVISVDIEESSITYLVENLEIIEGQQILYCTVNRYGDNYFFDNVLTTNIANTKTTTYYLGNNFKVKIWFISQGLY